MLGFDPNSVLTNERNGGSSMFIEEEEAYRGGDNGLKRLVALR